MLLCVSAALLFFSKYDDMMSACCVWGYWWSLFGISAAADDVEVLRIADDTHDPIHVYGLWLGWPGEMNPL